MDRAYQRRTVPARIAAVLAAAALLLAVTLPAAVTEVSADDNTMYTINYNVDVEVAENNSYDFHEHLDMYYVTPHHGIFRYLPKKGQRISGIRVPGYDYETYTESGCEVIKIGSGSYTLTGENAYDITYNIAMYEDENDEMDMLLLNLIPTDWETGIQNASCTVKLPKEADLSKAEVYSGTYGTEGNEDNAVMETSDDGMSITITAEDLPAHHGITMTLPLPQGYWQGAQEFGKMGLMNYLLFLLGPVGAAILWYLYGRDKHMVKTLEFYPPEDLTPGELGFIIDGKVNKQDVISSIVYLADKGYMQIEEIDRRNFRFYAIEAPADNEPQYVRTIYKGLFPDGRTEIKSTELGVGFGRKFQTSGEQLERMFKGKRSVRRADSVLARGACAVAAVMPAAAYVSWASANGDDIGTTGLVWTGIHILGATALMCSVYDRIRTTKKVVTVLKCLAAIWLFTVGVGILPIASDALSLLSRPKAMVLVLYLFLGTLVSIFFAVIATARTDRYTDLMGRILGFRDFIRTAELDKLNELVEDDPQYFYHIMPYAYVFGLSNKWIKNFEDIPVSAPDWYRGTRNFDAFDYYWMGRMMSDCSASVGSNIVLPESSGGGGSFSGGGGSWSGGGGFSGGGFSGGGAGGGGGGGW